MEADCVSYGQKGRSVRMIKNGIVGEIKKGSVREEEIDKTRERERA